MNDRTEGKIGNLKDISEMKTQAEETWIEWEYLKKTENRKKILKKRNHKEVSLIKKKKKKSNHLVPGT